MDRQEFESTHYQRVYQYLRRHIEQCDLDRFSYNGKVEGNPANCLKIILQWVKNFSVANYCFSFPLLFYCIPFLLPSTQLMWFAKPLMGWDSPFCQIFGCTTAVLWGVCILWPSVCWRCHGWSQGFCGQVYDSNVPGTSVEWLCMWLCLAKYNKDMHVTNICTTCMVASLLHNTVYKSLRRWSSLLG